MHRMDDEETMDASALPPAFYLREGDAPGTFRATDATVGPWSPQFQHGGPPAALMARAIEVELAEAGLDMRVARFTAAFHRPLPIDVFTVDVEPVREGRKVRTVRASMAARDGRVVASAEALLVRRAEVGVGATPGERPRAPEDCAPYVFSFFKTRTGYHVAMQGRLLHGKFGVGRMGLWLRMPIPLVPGEAPSALQRVVCAADSGNGVSVALDLARYTFVNPELTVVLARELEGSWVGLDATTTFGPDGVGLADTRLLDARGPIGRGLQSLVVERR